MGLRFGEFRGQDRGRPTDRELLTTFLSPCPPGGTGCRSKTSIRLTQGLFP